VPRSFAKSRTKADFKFPVPVKVSKARFKVSAAFRHIDPRRLANKAQVEVEVGTFEGEGCGSTVSAVVRKGTVVRLKVTPCAETRGIRGEPSLKALLSAARRRLGGTATRPKFKPMPFARFQDQGGDITIKTITCVQICIYGHCIVCCTLPGGGFFCGSRIIIHTP
jgi:hypothetical protein